MIEARWIGVGAILLIVAAMVVLGRRNPRRMITALVAAAIVVAAVYFGQWALAAGIVIASVFAGRELFWLFTEKGFRPAVWLGRVLALSFPPLVTLTGTRYLAPWLFACFLAIAATLVLRGAPWARRAGGDERVAGIADLAATFMGVAYVGWLPSYIPLIRQIPGSGMTFTYLFFLVLISTDIGAYLVGKRLGRTPLIGALSPRKTIEGAVGGTLLAMGVAAIVGWAGGLQPLPCLGLGLFISLAGQVSDLSESLVKRDAGKKDSGDAIPGHGGVLDRVDSYLLSAPVAFYYLVFVWPRIAGF